MRVSKVKSMPRKANPDLALPAARSRTLRRCATENLSLSDVREQLATKITGDKTNSMYRRYRNVDEDELREVQERRQAFPKNQVAVMKSYLAQD